MSFEIAIVGGGLSGLIVANSLRAKEDSRSWVLLEGHETRLGGRIRNSEEGDIDLGPAWIWPDHQPKIRSLVGELGVETFVQPDDWSSTRLAGGAFALIQALHKKLPTENIQMGFHVTKCVLTNEKVFLTSAKGDVISAAVAVFAAPPKILSKHVEFLPSLSASRVRAMDASRTWMAGVTKVALQYESRFWPLRGRISNTGLRTGANRPAFQVYDGSAANDKVVALTFFTVAHEHLSDDDLARACVAQLGCVKYFRSIHVKCVISIRVKCLHSIHLCHVNIWLMYSRFESVLG